MKAKLISLNAGLPQIVALEKLPVVLGRGAKADIQLSDRTLSRRHCEIDRVSATLVVRDLGSKNGTRVNRSHVAEAVLLPGDKLTLGACTFVVCYEHQAGSLPPDRSDDGPPSSADDSQEAKTTSLGEWANGSTDKLPTSLLDRPPPPP
ncbi:MAG TPA: FHA domain-containing protein [Pirellulales bacterium]|nr:FHA domain-containing protein [Pirellulales bacterium]